MFSDKDKVVKPGRLIIRTHAVRRMFERRIKAEDVRHVLLTGEVIEDYPNDFPYPSSLVLGWIGPTAIHVVAAYNVVDSETVVITVYSPQPDKWSEDFRRRV